ncbi:hypothetical protein DD237_003183 [Peronospora effusa]|uniref:PH domain-containing protein n=1 Tax=Peronospora effusa TaxID=542832 RepID=A0A425BZJ0_9STRA|nr:hypothetical protein DD237_003183 [Peronospora effusa]
MKALAYRLRSRHSRRNDEIVDDVKLSFCFVEAVKDESINDRSPGDKNRERRAMDDNGRKNRGNHNKDTDSCKKLAMTSATQSYNKADLLLQSEQPSFQPHRRTVSAPTMTRGSSLKQQHQHRMLAKAHFNSRADVTSNAADTLRLYDRLMYDRGICVASSSSIRHSQSSNGSTERSKHGAFISSNASSSSDSSQKPEVAINVRYSGILMIKRGPLKVADKRYYFVTCSSPELYSFRDEMSFKLWLSSGHSLRGGDAGARTSGLFSVLVGTVLRADAASEVEGSSGGSHSEKTFHVMMGLASKCFTLRFTAANGRKAMQWLEALQEVQLTKRYGNQLSRKLGSAADTRLLLPLDEHNGLCGAGTAITLDESTSEQGDTDMENMYGEAIDEIGDDREPAVMRSALTSNAKPPRVYTGGILQSKPRFDNNGDATTVSTRTSHSGSSPTSVVSEHANRPVRANLRASLASVQSLPTSRFHRMNSRASRSSIALGQSQGNTNGNVLLFVSVAGSSLTGSRMSQAQKELDALIAKGAKPPSRIMQDPTNGEPVAWRYGVPEYVLTDLAYVKGRMRDPDATPLASYVEECCQTFIMEATHKARYDQWRSVCQETFYLQVNDELRVPGRSILENDMFGLLYLGNVGESVGAAYGASNESRNLCAELAEAFPDGFPMEVLDVFTQPPQCYFAWRHWGLFAGNYRGIKGDGSRVEIRGFGEMTVNGSQIRSLRLFFKEGDLLFGLQQATGRTTPTRRDAAETLSLASEDVVVGRTVRAASAAVAPVTRKGSLTNPKTSEIIEGLANFTIKSKELHKKQIR